MRWLGNLALGLVLWCIAHADAWAEKRVALVIGNGAYTSANIDPVPMLLPLLSYRDGH